MRGFVDDDFVFLGGKFFLVRIEMELSSLGFRFEVRFMSMRSCRVRVFLVLLSWGVLGAGGRRDGIGRELERDRISLEVAYDPGPGAGVSMMK